MDAPPGLAVGNGHYDARTLQLSECARYCGCRSPDAHDEVLESGCPVEAFAHHEERCLGAEQIEYPCGRAPVADRPRLSVLQPILELHRHAVIITNGCVIQVL